MLWLLSLGFAADLDTTTLGSIRMPLTPNESFDTYTGVFEHTGAGNKQWQTDSPGFQCVGVGDILEVQVHRASWPRDVPKKVTCTADDNKKVKAKVQIVAKRHDPMFIADGTLIMPRDKGAAAIYDGAPPNMDLIVQQGKSGSLAIRCEVRQGPTLRVIVDAEAEDGSGQCALKDRAGELVRVPLKIVTAR